MVLSVAAIGCECLEQARLRNERKRLADLNMGMSTDGVKAMVSCTRDDMPKMMFWVTGLMHINAATVFSFVVDPEANVCAEQPVESTVCVICGLECADKDALAIHSSNPAPPVVDAVECCSHTGRIFGSSYALSTFERQRAESKQQNLTNADCETQTRSDTRDCGVIQRRVVSQADAGHRLRQYIRLKHLELGLSSKSSSASAIKQGRLLLNGEHAEASRIVKEGDLIELKPAALELARQHQAYKLHLVTEDVVVAWKPVGVRASGAFNGTLQSMVSGLLDADPTVDSQQLIASRLEIGCGGLCLVARNRDALVQLDSLKEEHQLFHRMVALVHGKAPDSWGEPGGATLVLTDVDGGSSRARVSRVAVSNHLCELSTCEIWCGAWSGRLCSVICHALRLLNLPVVGDRFCKREQQSIPRSWRCRGLGKSKLQVGCYGVHADLKPPLDQIHVELELPPRMLASHWDSVTESLIQNEHV